MVRPIFWLLLGLSVSSQAAFSLTGRFTATVSTVDLPNQTVEGWLPEGVTLDNSLDRQKVVVMMGTQRNVAHFAPYQEIIVVLPKVLFQGREYMYFPRLYLNHRGAVRWGIAVYGFPKLFGWMTSRRDGYQLRDAGTEEGLLKADFQISEQSLPLSSPNFVEMKELLSRPMLLFKNGSVLCSEFIMTFNEGQLWPAAVDLSVMAGFMDGWEASEDSSEGLDESRFGSFHMQNVHWRVPSTGRVCP